MVKPEKIKERLKAKWPKANLSTKRLDEIAARLAKKPADDADDAAIDAVLDEANDFFPFEEIAREDDRIRTLENNQKAPGQGEPPKPAPSDPPKSGDDTPEWAKAILESNKTLKEELEALKKGEVVKSKKQSALQAIESSEVFKALKPEHRQKWADRINIDSEVSVEDQVKEIEVEFTEIKQQFANSNHYAPPAPFSGKPNEKPADADVDAIVDKLI